MKEAKKEYKVVYDDSLIAFGVNKINYMVYKKFLWFYLPLYFTRYLHHFNAYDKTQIDVQDITEIKRLFDGRYLYSRNRPMWFDIATNKRLRSSIGISNNEWVVKTDFYDSYEDFVDQNAEMFI